MTCDEELLINDVRVWIFFMEVARGMIPLAALQQYSDFIDSKGGFYHA